MNKDKKKLYLISFISLVVLLIAFFVPLKDSKILSACLLLGLAVVARLLVRKRSSYSINKKEVLLLSGILGVLYVVAVQMSGIFFGFYKNPYFVNLQIVLTVVLPITAMIVASEMLRSTLLDQKNSLVSALVFITCVLAEVLTFSNASGFTSFNRFMDLVALTLFPTISANVYYHYTSRRFGAVPNIVFRLITTLYVYFIPTVADIPDAIFSMIKIILPIGMYALIAAMFEKKKRDARKKDSKIGFIAIALSVTFILSVSMLISCQFRFCAIVIATESMTGEINKGDMIIYESYTDQTIKEGQVVVFLQDQNKIVHRVVRIDVIDGEVRYITKGDANESEDLGYITDKDIVGLTNVKIAYVGFPTLWLRELLEGSN